MPAQVRKLSVLASALTSDIRQAPTLAREAGFAGLLFDAFSPAVDVASLSGTGRREFRQLLFGQDRELVGFRIDLGAKGFGPGGDVDRLLWQLKKILEAAAELAAPLLCVELGPLPEPVREKKAKPKVTEEMAGLILLPTFAAAPAPEVTDLHSIPAQIDPVFVAQVDGAMAELGVLADRYNVTVAFRCDLASFAALERALVAARCSWFGVDLDPVAMLSDAWSMNEIFSRLGSFIRHVRARDSIAGADHRTKPTIVGQGDIKWDELLSDFEGAGFHGWMTVDPMDLTDRASAAVAGLKFLKNID